MRLLESEIHLVHALYSAPHTAHEVLSFAFCFSKKNIRANFAKNPFRRKKCSVFDLEDQKNIKNILSEI